MPTPAKPIAAAAAVAVAAAVAASAAALAGSAPAPDGAGVARRAVIVLVDGTMRSDWTSADLPTFRALLEQGALALLSTRTGAAADDPAALRASGAASLGAGSRAEARPLASGAVEIEGGGVTPGLLGEALARAGRPATAVGDAGGSDVADASGSLAAMRADGTIAAAPGRFARTSILRRGAAIPDARFPTGARTDFRALLAQTAAALEWASLVVVDTGDTARVERAHGFTEDPRRTLPERDAWMRLAMRRADAFLARLRRTLTPADLLVVAAVTPPAVRTETGRHLTEVAMVGAGLRPGLLSSGTTRRAGVLSITDLAPTVLSRLGAPLPAEAAGRTAALHPARDAPGAIRALERDIIHAHAIRHPLTRGMLWVAMAIAAAAVGTLLRAGRRPGARAWRDALATLLIATAAAPLALLLEPLLGARTTESAAMAVTVVALFVAAASRLLLGPARALPAVAGLTAAVVLADLALGAPLGSRSALSFLVTSGHRFWGIGNELMGVVVGGALFAAAAAADRGREALRASIWTAAALGLAVVLMAAPWLGGKFGAALTAVPAFGAFLVLSRRGRLERPAVIGIAIATVLVAGLLVAADLLRAPEAQGHVARAAGGSGGASVALRKIEAALQLLAFSIWPRALAVFAGAAAVLAWRRPGMLARGLWGRPGLRAALWASGIAAAAAVLFNDAGLIAAALVAMIGAASLLSVLLVPD